MSVLRQARRSARLPRPGVHCLGAMVHAASAAGCVTTATARRRGDTALWRRLVWSVERGRRSDDRPVPRAYRMQGLRSRDQWLCRSASRSRGSPHDTMATKPVRHRQRPELCSFRIGRSSDSSCIRFSRRDRRGAGMPPCRQLGAACLAPFWLSDRRVRSGCFGSNKSPPGPIHRSQDLPANGVGDQPAGCAANAAAMVSRSGVVRRPISLLKVWLSSNRLPPPADAEHCASTWAKPAGSPAWTRAAA